MKNDIDQRIFYWIRSHGIEEASLKDSDLAKRLRARLRVVHKSLYHLRHISKSPRIRAKHWRMIHEALGFIALDAAMSGLMNNDNKLLNLQDEILTLSTKEMDLKFMT